MALAKQITCDSHEPQHLHTDTLPLIVAPLMLTFWYVSAREYYMWHVTYV